MIQKCDENLPKISDRLYCVIGPSASGKSAFAIRLAQRLRQFTRDIAIVNVDVMQMYDGLAIATNKPTAEDCEGFSHYFIGHLSPFNETKDSNFSHDVTKHYGNKHNIIDFLPRAISLIENLQSTHTTVILTGGTLYYVQAILTELVQIPSEESPRIHEAKDYIRSIPQNALHSHLRSLDAGIAARWHPNDYRHIRRSIEVILENDVSERAVIDSEARVRYDDHAIFWLDTPISVLDERISERVQQMDKRGICAEVTYFFLRNHGRSNAFADAIGYKEFYPYLQHLVNQRELAKERLGCKPNKRKSESWKGGIHLWNKCLLDLVEKTKSYTKKQIRWIRNKFRTHSGLILFRVELGSENGEYDNLKSQELDNLIISPILNVTQHPKRVPCFERSKTVNRVKFCSNCEKYLENEIQWTAHIGSRQHRKNIARNTQIEYQKAQQA